MGPRFNMPGSSANQPTSGDPKTPPKANELWREGLTSPVPMVLCTSDAQEDVPSLDIGSESIASPRPVAASSPSQHLRQVISGNTASSGASSLNFATAMQVGTQLSGST